MKIYNFRDYSDSDFLYRKGELEENVTKANLDILKNFIFFSISASLSAVDVSISIPHSQYEDLLNQTIYTGRYALSCLGMANYGFSIARDFLKRADAHKELNDFLDEFNWNK